MNNDLHFPKNFLWGTATSSYQIEGGIMNDWEVDQHVPNAGRSGDHWNRFEEDFALAASLNTNAYRFSVEWARIEPEEGRFDEEAIGHYAEMIASMEAHGLEPFLTLHHFTHPAWFGSDGWLRNDAIEVFDRFVERVVHDLGGSLKFWCTVNEPLIYAGLAHVWNTFPARKGRWLAYRVVRQLMRAHRAAYRTIKKRLPDAQVGIVKNNRPFYASGLGYAAKPFADWLWNHWFLHGVKNETDFIGLNYYHPSVIGAMSEELQSAPTTDMGWKVWPEGFYETLMALKRYQKPIYITENGLADDDDDTRPRFIVQHLEALHRAMEDGVDVRGYFYWSLLDNFEWAHGFGPRFGLIEIDYETLERTKRPSADVYTEICKTNAVSQKLLDEYR